MSTAFLLALCVIGIVIAAVQIVKESHITAAENAERGKLRIAQEERDITAATLWLSHTPVCPDCKTADGRRRDSDGAIILYEDGPMSLSYRYCHDLWHSAFHVGSGTYGGFTAREALIKIGEQLRRQ